MAIHIYTTYARRAILAVCAMICVAASARADLVYHLTVCGGDGPAQPGGACFVQNAVGGGSPVSPTEGALKQFFDNQGLITEPALTFAVLGSNQAGYVYGSVSDGYMLNGYFISFQGQVLCCTEDSPFAITGLNDSGIFIGQDDRLFPFASTAFTEFAVADELPTLDETSLQFLAGDPWLFFYMSQFDAIDNQNRISGFGRQGAFLLTPVGAIETASVVPEPGSLFLLIAALALFGLWWKASDPTGAARS